MKKNANLLIILSVLTILVGILVHKFSIALDDLMIMFIFSVLQTIILVTLYYIIRESRFKLFFNINL